MLWHWFGAMVWRMNIARIDIARMWPGVYARTGLTLACSQREKVGALQLHLSHTYIHTYLPFYLLDLSPPPLSFLPSPTPLQPLKLIIGRSWLVGLSGPLIFGAGRSCHFFLVKTWLWQVLTCSGVQLGFWLAFVSPTGPTALSMDLWWIQGKLMSKCQCHIAGPLATGLTSVWRCWARCMP